MDLWANLQLGGSFQVIGICGFFTYLISFAALQFGALDGNSIAYSVLNVIAAALVLISLTETFNLASALIQLSWIIIGIAGLMLRWYRKRLP